MIMSEAGRHRVAAVTAAADVATATFACWKRLSPLWQRRHSYVLVVATETNDSGRALPQARAVPSAI